MTQSQPTNDSQNAAEMEEKIQQWNKEQVVKVQKYCFNNGVQFKGFVKNKCLGLPPLIGVWYIQSQTKGDEYWSISGDFPTDMAKADVAKDPRDAIRYFSMSWQLKASRMEDSLAEGKIQLGDAETQKKAIIELVNKAETLSAMYNDEKLWQGSNLKAQ